LGRIIIPRLGIDAPIVKVAWHIEQIEGQALAVWDVAVNAVGHHSGTSPLGGEGNCVLAGHSRAAEGAVFRALDQAQVGDEIFLRWGEASERAYLVEEVTQVAEVGASLADRLANAECMAATDEARLTLITCWPDWAYTHRLIVVARPR
jgi:sortase A